MEAQVAKPHHLQLLGVCQQIYNEDYVDDDVADDGGPCGPRDAHVEGVEEKPVQEDVEHGREDVQG